MENLKYPIGKFTADRIELPRKERISQIREFPEKLSLLLKDVEPERLRNSYRPGGWNIQQLIHHCADSHMNGFIRFKLALTENNPTILPYSQPQWAALPDSTDIPPDSSLLLLTGLHQRWNALLNAMSEEQFLRTFINPENPIGTFTLDLALALYSWHCEHHLAHMKLAVRPHQ